MKNVPIYALAIFSIVSALAVTAADARALKKSNGRISSIHPEPVMPRTFNRRQFKMQKLFLKGKPAVQPSRTRPIRPFPKIPGMSGTKRLRFKL